MTARGTTRSTPVRALSALVVGLLLLTGCSAVAEGDQPQRARAAAQVKPRAVEPAVVMAKPQRVARAVVIEEGLTPGPTLYGPGASSPEVRDLQARLRQIAWYFGDVSDDYDAATVTAVQGFQAKREFPVTGEVDQRTLTRLHEMTREPTEDELNNVEPEPEPEPEPAAPGLDPRCRSGRVMCIDKSTNSLRWVVDGDVRLTLDARFGGNGYNTREGQFSVFSKSRYHVSSLYDSEMPFAMFFSGGQAVHYSPDFAAVGYSGASHGCVNIRDYDSIAWLYDEVAIGDRVVVYWS